MKLQLQVNKIKVNLLLSIATILVVLIEIYLAYVYLYPNLNVAEDLITVKDIVRVDLKSYDQTINLLDNLESYQAPPLNLPRNPYQ